MSEPVLIVLWTIAVAGGACALAGLAWDAARAVSFVRRRRTRRRKEASLTRRQEHEAAARIWVQSFTRRSKR